VIADLPAQYHAPLAAAEVEILNTPVSLTASSVRNHECKPLDILLAYGKRAIWAHQRTNCLTEIAIPSAEEWLHLSLASPHSPELGGVNLRGPLAGVPVSLKDTVGLAGYESCIGYSRFVGDKIPADAAIVRLLKDAGSVPFVKTNVPVTLLSFESTNEVFGRTDNPHVPGFSPGGSTGGEAALLALGGSRIGVGTDVAGSVRVPAAWSGVYALRCSVGRFPKAGCRTSMPGQEGVVAVYSPMAKSMEDLRYFMKSIVEMKPWEYDYTVHPIPWREPEGKEKIRWGVLRDDGVVPPTPAIERALNTTAEALLEAGDEVFELEDTPSCYDALRLASRLLNSDAGATYNSHFTSIFESNDAGVSILNTLFYLPRFAKTLYAAYHRYIRRDPITAGLIEDFHSRSVASQWQLVTQREDMRRSWFEYLKENHVDFILTPANALPAVPAGGMKDTVASCGYTFIWNLLDYSAGVVPVGRVDPVLDAARKINRSCYGVGPAVAIVGGEEKGGREVRLTNLVASKAWGVYDAAKMAGLPTAVQIVGGRLEEERVLGAMERVVDALRKKGVRYQEVVVEID